MSSDERGWLALARMGSTGRGKLGVQGLVVEEGGMGGRGGGG